MRRILVTGSSGQVGRHVVAALQANGWHVVGLDRAAPTGQPPQEFVQGEVNDPALLRQAMQGVACVIHLAAAPDDDPLPELLTAGPAEDDNFLSQLVPANLIGPVEVLKAAVNVGVRRVVLASSGQVIDGALGDADSRVDAGTPLAPRYLYACTKVFLESLGRVFAKRFGIEVLAVRLGWCPRPGQGAAIKAYPMAPYVYLSGPDAGRLFAAVVNAPEWPRTSDARGGIFPFGVVYATSIPQDGREVYDLAPARNLGFTPRDRWDPEAIAD